MNDMTTVSTPALVREFARLREQSVCDAFTGRRELNHDRLDAVVVELRTRGILD